MFRSSIFAVALILAALGNCVAAAQTIAITDVTAIDPRSAGVRAHATVIVRNGRISSIDASRGNIPKGARIVNGTGKFLIPGLWDAHVHLTKTGVLSLPLFVANGITGVRDMGSDLDDVLKWREEIKAGKLIGPRIKTSGRIIESRENFDRMKQEGTVEPVERIRIGVSNPDEGRAAVSRLAAAGVDHIKMRTTPNFETFQAIAEESRRRSLPLTAHPLAPPEQLMGSGLRSVEHALTYPPLNTLTESQRRELFRRMRDAGMYLSNTMVTLDGLISTPYSKGINIVQDAAGKVDVRRKYLCGYLIEDWREQVEEGKDAPYEPLRKELPNLFRDFREMREEGVQFLAGTDAGVVFMYPGFSLHDELQQLVEHVGFSAMEALRIGTDGVAGFYGEQNKFGALEVGQLAELVLLDANPLADIRNTKRVAGVLTRGRWLSRRDLDGIFKRLEKSASTRCDGSGLAQPH